MLFALLPDLHRENSHCLEPGCLKGFSGGNSAFLLSSVLPDLTFTQCSPGTASPTPRLSHPTCLHWKWL